MGMDKAVAAKQVDALESMIDQRRSWMNGDPAHDQMIKTEVATLRFSIAAIQSLLADEKQDKITIRLVEGTAASIVKKNGMYDVLLFGGKAL